MPFYCDPVQVGAFAVEPAALAAGDEAALFRLFVALSMFQALRDTIIMARQRSLTVRETGRLADLPTVAAAIRRQRCAAVRAADFVAACDVVKSDGVVDCGRHPGARCHVKDATVGFHRMGDLGKLPTSAWLALWRAGGLAKVLAEVCAAEEEPRARALRLVEQVEQVHRVGRKLASLFVSALSTPTLAPGLTPWWPAVDGNELVVVDTNVARAVDVLRGPGHVRSYEARSHWLRSEAARIDLRAIRADLPRYSPRLVQEALYAFGSRSNRTARGDACAGRATPCPRCDARLCPFVAGR